MILACCGNRGADPAKETVYSVGEPGYPIYVCPSHESLAWD